jgi:hypothetical protein
MSERLDWDRERRVRPVRERGSEPVDEVPPTSDWVPDEPSYRLAEPDQHFIDVILLGLRVDDDAIGEAARLADPCEQRKRLSALLTLLDKNQTLGAKLVASYNGDAKARGHMRQRLDMTVARLRNSIRRSLDPVRLQPSARSSPSRVRHFPGSQVRGHRPDSRSSRNGPVTHRRITDEDRLRFGLRCKGLGVAEAP